METKKRIAQVIVYLAVFSGTVLGTGIAFLTDNTSRRIIREDIEASCQGWKRSSVEYLQYFDNRLTEAGAQVIARAELKLNNLGITLHNAKKTFLLSYNSRKERMHRSGIKALSLRG